MGDLAVDKKWLHRSTGKEVTIDSVMYNPFDKVNTIIFNEVPNTLEEGYFLVLREEEFFSLFEPVYCPHD